MTYTPHRDHRFYYATDLINFIESNSCVACKFRKSIWDYDPAFAEKFPMCAQIEALIMMEEPIEALDDHGDDGVYCNLFVNGNPQPPADPDQLTLGV